jgi:hypothetical protein
MNKLLMTAAALLALVAPAYAGSTIPADYRGEWCSMGAVGYFVQRSVVKLYRAHGATECADNTNGWVRIGANHYFDWQRDCKPVSVTKPVNGYIIVKLRCSVEEGAEEFDHIVGLVRTPGSGDGSWIKRLYIEDKSK